MNPGICFGGNGTVNESQNFLKEKHQQTSWLSVTEVQKLQSFSRILRSIKLIYMLTCVQMIFMVDSYPLANFNV